MYVPSHRALQSACNLLAVLVSPQVSVDLPVMLAAPWPTSTNPPISWLQVPKRNTVGLRKPKDTFASPRKSLNRKLHWPPEEERSNSYAPKSVLADPPPYPADGRTETYPPA
ncbi:hypothetical protein GGTG_00001 [Gaeumannomyces tritici R3-111a-1]|uniref:Uncharacterized protein n=1 Tax=Gaeumannomyces tritici (strain R3-111a-1) TaxID=644352 RepID=J3NFF5_GAET3|nr:hypothetical protein GGTG_00001 [Gaeumannomyces tritici R3-111a-1]EJT79994.1 hypothetical protein GGTG_00001 [Gaeumannomyces tritici R3-111a-1]